MYAIKQWNYYNKMKHLLNNVSVYFNNYLKKYFQKESLFLY